MNWHLVGNVDEWRDLEENLKRSCGGRSPQIVSLSRMIEYRGVDDGYVN